MKKLLLLIMLVLSVQANAQIYGTNYFWSGAISIDTTATDTLFAVEWQDVTFWSLDGNVQFKAACNNDTSGFYLKDWLAIGIGQSVTFSPVTKLKRLSVKLTSGSGTLYIAGYKKTSQY